MKHSQAFVLLMLATTVLFALAAWANSLWGALGVLIFGLVAAFVMSMAWLWSPKSGLSKHRRRSAKTES